MNTPEDVFYRIQRGLVGYVSYLAACEMNPAFSEYVLYEPALRIFTARGFTVHCEVACPGLEHPRRGDRKKLDFVATGHGYHFAIEMKWARKVRCNISKDREKLVAFKARTLGARAFLCVFGRHSHLLKFESGSEFRQFGHYVDANLRKTRYGCFVFELR